MDAVVKQWIVQATPVSVPHPTRVVLFGLGQIGQRVARLAGSRGGFEIIGAADIDPAKVGRSLREVCQSAELPDVRVVGSVEEIRAAAGAVALHTTGSQVGRIAAELTALAQQKLNVVSSAEELLEPWARDAEVADALDQTAKEQGVTLVGAGVNPGFVMDLLPVALTCVCQVVNKVSVQRVVDAATRRPALQKKVGAGMTAQEFLAEVEAGRMGHVGLVESALFVAQAMGWRLDRLEEVLGPMMAERDLTTDVLTVGAGTVAGIKHTAEGYVGDKLVLDLDLRMYVGAEEPHDAVQIEGEPPLDVVVRGGTAGDAATAAALVNAAPRVAAAAPGLVRLRELALAQFAPAEGLRLAVRAEASDKGKTGAPRGTGG
ncbi:MAG: dihydrodipicolinate reductase [Armatimonadetes bacterium CG_4_10_14_3_um_filter_66_18]|nr:dihydrodipicolinate reductase [Armatimonadota bacterium]OIP04063.1 MAG: hypothetical protein AUJ96_13545 [Armatimonadetes bacterium CG2_30_66_41]PIU91949.1 MAG: dihydrodipicolinate reductase [Armatimonadetes bacterium CG06_land_8_20_14_3_00_66_21]PIW12825.1 MAG: dihydrodipicolinate reductase [Armatimonadetes bacterium CG17_big_fil_post_rev_8_21_14_2_50_66_6]PIX39337.1 MAG: dihydrodipicolinate reductase [Armatimonadetes bacterium CG_4_8_14_3_um_filter_66_20]PIY51260.1 MAG: dihydrodipicolinat